ncbi:MAG: hypothetical protein BLM47_02805 [Candidatus Reconcilbacillus cellulovorans]|uniref:Methylated-DNA--protein-cysteine methyltransferase n=1 Tax=Candidatus Reconcilbacillus cellulovorans TaxID=1906605 RepID=A0A2A6E2N9_9BACL|nr:MAG: hypothetical protein BLM47_02805 [Candidatus Reconcilbacillus cellulovorans]
MLLRLARTDSPIGPLLLVRSDAGLCRVDFGEWDECAAELRRWAKRWYGDGVRWREDEDALTEEIRQLREYFAGARRAFDLELDLRGTPFQLAVWRALCGIPYGETRSYGDVARAVGRPKACRAVGAANHVNPVSIVVPCHRVVGADGALVGYGGGLDRKERLLALERANGGDGREVCQH